MSQNAAEVLKKLPQSDKLQIKQAATIVGPHHDNRLILRRFRPRNNSKHTDGQ